jgi:hypothetical protein
MQFCRLASTPKPQPYARGGSKTVGRWLKDRRERKKEETRAHNAQVHAAVSVAAVAAAVAAVAAATAAASSSSGSGKDDRGARTDMAVASAATLVAAQCVEAAEAMGAEREHLAAAVGSAVNVRNPGDVVTITAAAATGSRRAQLIPTAPGGIFCSFQLGVLTRSRRVLFELCRSVARRGDAEGEGAEGGVERRGGDPRGERCDGRR